MRSSKQSCLGGLRGPDGLVEADEMEEGRRRSFKKGLGFPTNVFIPHPLGVMDSKTFILSLLKGHLM